LTFLQYSTTILHSSFKNPGFKTRYQVRTNYYFIFYSPSVSNDWRSRVGVPFVGLDMVSQNGISQRHCCTPPQVPAPVLIC